MKYIAVFLFFCVKFCLAQKPILPDFHADPSIHYWDYRYWIYPSTGEKATVKLFNILGKQVMQSSFTTKNVQDISLPKLSTGVYIVQLENGTNKINKKIILE